MPAAGATQVSARDGMTQVYIPAGEFTMGADASQLTVTLSAFWMDRTEVTNGMYAKCVAEGACVEPQTTSSPTRPKYYGHQELANFPVIYMTWKQANAYCTWAGRALPTEAQWEKAARGTDARRYPWGNDRAARGTINIGQTLGDTSAVGVFAVDRSFYGVMDMGGNVQEWLADWYADGYDFSAGPDPLGPALGDFKVVRGSSWVTTDDALKAARTTLRYSTGPFQQYPFLGFRCAQAAPLP